jgi:hypothetical protein
MEKPLDFYREKETGRVVRRTSSTHAEDYKGLIYHNFNDEKLYEKLGDKPEMVARYLIEQGMWMFEEINRHKDQKLEDIAQQNPKQPPGISEPTCPTCGSIVRYFGGGKFKCDNCGDGTV